MYDFSYDTPYKNYDEIVSAVKRKEAVLSFQRSMANTIYGLLHPYIGVLLIWLGFVLGLLVLLGFSVYISNYWLLLFGIPIFYLNTMVVHIKKIIIPLAVLLACFAFGGNEYLWISAIGFSLIALTIGYEIWWSTIYNGAISNLLSNENLFEEVWKSNRMAIKTPNKFYTYRSKTQ
jgi:hypothetical protein